MTKQPGPQVVEEPGNAEQLRQVLSDARLVEPPCRLREYHVHAAQQRALADRAPHREIALEEKVLKVRRVREQVHRAGVVGVAVLRRHEIRDFVGDPAVLRALDNLPAYRPVSVLSDMVRLFFCVLPTQIH